MPGMGPVWLHVGPISVSPFKQGLLGDSRFKKVGEEAWTEQEVTSEHDDQKSLNSTPAATTEEGLSAASTREF